MKWCQHDEGPIQSQANKFRGYQHICSAAGKHEYLGTDFALTGKILWLLIEAIFHLVLGHHGRGSRVRLDLSIDAILEWRAWRNPKEKFWINIRSHKTRVWLHEKALWIFSVKVRQNSKKTFRKSTSAIHWEGCALKDNWLKVAV